MAKIDIKRTELVWKGKYDDDGKLIPVDLPGPYPFQIVEIVNSPRIGHDIRGVQTSLYDTWQGNEGSTFEDGWKNKLIWGDNKFVMSSLLEKFAGKIDLIYIDPPFATGADFTVDIEVGENGKEIHKEHSIIEEKAYRDTWGQGMDSFLQMMYDRIIIMKDLLSEKGSFFIHLDYRTVHYIKVICDEIFGCENLKNELIWIYTRMASKGQRYFNNTHQTILWYCKSNDYLFNVDVVRTEYSEGSKNRAGYKKKGVGSGVFKEETLCELNEKGKFPDDYFDIPFVRNKIYPTEKPELLIEKLINATTTNQSIVADFFCGSGSTLTTADKLGRRWIGVDLGRYAIHTTRKRLLEIEHSKCLSSEGREYGQKARPFEILNLGKYERQFWQVKAFSKKDEKQALYEYLAFILKLYGAEPIAGSLSVHGKKGNALVYIGAVDSPVTIQEVQDALRDSKGMGMKELHVLGWEWEMGLNDAIQEVARQMEVRLKLRIIPMDVLNEQATRKGDIKFFELAYFKAKLEVTGRKLSVILEDFCIPHTDLIPQDVQNSITRWSDWIDYWAVDFEFQNDTFNNTWTSYRTKQNRKLALKAEKIYDKHGTYKVFVKIIDIFGIDTSQVYEITIQ